MLRKKQKKRSSDLYYGSGANSAVLQWHHSLHKIGLPGQAGPAGEVIIMSEKNNNNLIKTRETRRTTAYTYAYTKWTLALHCAPLKLHLKGGTR